MALIGVAVAVPDPYGEELERWRAEFGDPQASRIPAHITMLPPVRVDDAELESVDLHLTRAAGSVTAYDVILKGTGTFRPVSPVVFVALAAGMSGCERLQAAVHRAPLDPSLDHPYHPHVTVAHHLPDDALDRAFETLSGFEARFRVTAVSLYLHGKQGWAPVRTFPLGDS